MSPASAARTLWRELPAPSIHTDPTHPLESII